MSDDGSVQYSIDALMSRQDDFLQETTLLQYHASLLGVALERSPKCHPEIAGEGIEYGWALSKMNYCRSPMEEKRGKETFWKLVQKCLDRRTVLNIKRMRACSRKARDYMVLYQAVELLNLNNTAGNKTGQVLNKHSLLEDSIKLYCKGP